MKNIRKTILAAALCAMVLPAFGQPDETGVAEPMASVETTSATDDGGDAEAAASGDKSFGITIEVDTDSGDDDGDGRHKAVMSVMAEVMQAIPKELRDEMSDEDRVKFEQALEVIESGDYDKASGGHNIVINSDHGGGGPTDWVGLAAVILLFGGPVVIVALVSWSNRRKREMVHRSIDRMVENGLEVPAELLDALDKGKGGKSALQRGTVNVAVGIGLGVALWNIADQDVATIALIPLCIGLAQLLVWRLESGEDSAR